MSISNVVPATSEGLDKHARAGERSIGYAQAALVALLLLLHVVSASKSNFETLSIWVCMLLGFLFLSSVWRTIRAQHATAETKEFVFLDIIDTGALVATICSYSIAYSIPFESMSKSPSVFLLFAFVGLRALRFSTLGVIVSGGAVLFWWICVTAIFAAIAPEVRFASGYAHYLTSHTLLIGAEIEKVIALVLMTAAVAIGSHRARANTGRMDEARKTAAVVTEQLERQTELWKFQARLLDVISSCPHTWCNSQSERGRRVAFA